MHAKTATILCLLMCLNLGASRCVNASDGDKQGGSATEKQQLAAVTR